jgi:hypothetical protein
MDVQHKLSNIQDQNPDMIAHADIKVECDERLQQFVTNWQQAEPPLPQPAQDERMAIDSLHADLIHLEAEKNVFVLQASPARRPEWLVFSHAHAVMQMYPCRDQRRQYLVEPCATRQDRTWLNQARVSAVTTSNHQECVRIRMVIHENGPSGWHCTRPTPKSKATCQAPDQG